jgi:hypothetical protein
MPEEFCRLGEGVKAMQPCYRADLDRAVLIDAAKGAAFREFSGADEPPDLRSPSLAL